MLCCVTMENNGRISLNNPNWAKWKTNDDDNITSLNLLELLYAKSHLHVIRLTNWGWELQDDNSNLFRAIDEENNRDEIWKDLTANIIVQERPEWAEVKRTHFEVNYREVPDDEDCKALSW